MAHYAYLDENNIVTQVIVGKDENELINGLDTETYYGAVRTSYNGKIRYNFAGIGYTYDPIDDAFIPPMPECAHESLLLNAQKRWECAECEAALEAATL
jgi:hypothetical protein